MLISVNDFWSDNREYKEAPEDRQIALEPQSNRCLPQALAGRLNPLDNQTIIGLPANLAGQPGKGQGINYKHNQPSPELETLTPNQNQEDVSMTRASQFSHLSLEEFKKVVEMYVEVLNYALNGISPERMRMHVCWGNTEGPHHHDVPLREIIDIVLKARPLGLSFEGANPRHAHEWKVWREVKLPEGKVIIPGVLDTTTNFIEHPELVAERITRYAEIVGRENVIAGSDCGFGTSAWGRKVVTTIAWAKLQAMVEGARLASQELW
jgi:methionine synthase II (cobalamin-independent)